MDLGTSGLRAKSFECLSFEVNCIQLLDIISLQGATAKSRGSSCHFDAPLERSITISCRALCIDGFVGMAQIVACHGERQRSTQTQHELSATQLMSLS